MVVVASKPRGRSVSASSTANFPPQGGARMIEEAGDVKEEPGELAAAGRGGL